MVAALVHVVGAGVYVALASGSQQPWADREDARARPAEPPPLGDAPGGGGTVAANGKGGDCSPGDTGVDDGDVHPIVV